MFQPSYHVEKNFSWWKLFFEITFSHSNKNPHVVKAQDLFPFWEGEEEETIESPEEGAESEGETTKGAESEGETGIFCTNNEVHSMYISQHKWIQIMPMFKKYQKQMCV